MHETSPNPGLMVPAPKVFNREEGRTYTGKQKTILEAAHYLISQKGIKHATITQIAKRAGVADSIIYHYFKNKEDVILSVLDLQMLNALEDLKFHFTGIIGPISKLGKMVWYHLSMNDQGDAQMRKNMLLECRNFPNFLTHKSYSTLQQYTGVMDGILEQGVREGYIAPQLNISLARTVILGFLDEMALVESATGKPSNTLADFELVMDLIRAMLGASTHKKSGADEPGKYTRILHSAKKLYAEKGFKNTTISEVAQLAGVAEGTIYEYFKNKQDLLLSITKEYFSFMKANLDNAFTIDMKQPSGKLRRLMWHHFTLLGTDRDLVTVFLKDTKLEKYFYKDEAHDVFYHYHDKICEVLDEGKEMGVFRPEIDTRVFRNLIMGSLASVYTRWYFRQPVLALDYMTELHQYIDLISRTVAAKTSAPE